MPDQTYRVNEPDVIYQLFDEEVVAIHLPSGVYYSLTGLGGEVFLAIGPGGVAGRQIVEDLVHKYDATRETIERDIDQFLDVLGHNSLIVPHSAAAAPRPVNGSPSPLTRLPYHAPSLQSHADLTELFLLDPVHDVSSAGWPNLPEADAEPAPAPVWLDLETEPAFQCEIAGTHVIFERFPEETVVVHGSTGAYFSLYGPAEDVFLLLPDKPTLEEMHRALTSKYNLDDIDLDLSLRQYLRSLRDANLIVAERINGVQPRELTLARPGSSLPFSTLSLQIFGEAPGPVIAPAQAAAAEPVPVGQRRYRTVSQDILSAEVGDETVLADRESGSYYYLNAPAADAFLLLRKTVSMEELTAALSGRYEIIGRDMTAAAMVFVGHLLRMNLIVAVAAEPVAAEPADSFAARELPGLEPKKPFRGFEVVAHRDLIDLLRPMNPALAPFPDQKSRTGRGTQLSFLMHQCFEGAAQQSGVSESYFDIGDTLVRLRRTGMDSADLEKAWTHLRRAESAAMPSPGLTIHLLTGPPANDYFLSILFEKLEQNWSVVCGPRGEVLEFHTERIPVIFHPGPNVLSVLDIERGQAYFFKPDPAPFPYWEIGSPFRYLLHCWFAARGLQFVHGGAVGGPSGGVLLAGKGGSGKSTTTLLCTKAGMTYAGDDYCLVDPREGFLYSLYSTAKLKGPEDLVRVPEVRGASHNPDGFEQGGDGKGIFFVSDLWPDRMSAGFPLRAILIPRVATEQESRLERCSPGEALLALLPSTVAQLPAANQADCDRLAQLAAQLPAYVLHLGSDLDQIPVLVRKAAG